MLMVKGLKDVVKYFAIFENDIFPVSCDICHFFTFFQQMKHKHILNYDSLKKMNYHVFMVIMRSLGIQC
jgi:hypothetical protein